MKRYTLPIWNCMDRRLESRATANLPATIAQLGSNAPPMRTTVVNISGKGLGITLETSFSVGVLVRIDLGDAILLGEVIHCCTTETGCAVGVNIRHALYGVSGLVTVAERFMARK